MSHVPAAMPLDGLRSNLSPAELIAQQVQIVIGTRPGQVPWRPDFGCDLSSLVGQPASSKNVDRARSLIERALGEFLPDVELERLEVRAARIDDFQELAHRNIPIVETALLSLGTQAHLEVLIEVRVPRGSAVVTATVNP